jgi:hypothetical protein
MGEILSHAVIDLRRFHLRHQDPGVRRGATQANLTGLRRLRLRKLKFVREQFYLAAVAQNPETTGAVPQHESATSDGKLAKLVGFQRIS